MDIIKSSSCYNYIRPDKVFCLLVIASRGNSKFNYLWFDKLQYAN